MYFPYNHLYSVTSVMSNSLWPYGLYPPCSSVHEILQARILEWAVMPSSREFLSYTYLIFNCIIRKNKHKNWKTPFSIFFPTKTRKRNHSKWENVLCSNILKCLHQHRDCVKNLTYPSVRKIIRKLSPKLL